MEKIFEVLIFTIWLLQFNFFSSKFTSPISKKLTFFTWIWKKNWIIFAKISKKVDIFHHNQEESGQFLKDFFMGESHKISHTL